MNRIRRVSVFAGSSPGRPGDQEIARSLGESLAGAGLEIVYGGGREGMMGALADGVLAVEGRIRGVLIPMFQAVAHPRVDKIEEVPSMYERKRGLIEASDASVALPGGIGTFDEVFEVLSLAQLQISSRPMILLDHEDYFRPLVELFDRAIEAGYIRPADRDLIQVVERVEQVVPVMQAWKPPVLPDKRG